MSSLMKGQYSTFKFKGLAPVHISSPKYLRSVRKKHCLFFKNLTFGYYRGPGEGRTTIKAIFLISR